MPSLPSVLAALTVVLLLLTGCSGDGPELVSEVAADAVPDDPAATAAELATAFDDALRGLDGRYAFDLRVAGTQPVRVEGLHLGDRTTATRVESGSTLETIVIEGNAIARRDGGVWVPVDPPTDHDPLAPLLAVTEVAVTGWDVELSYPAAMLGLEGDWVGAAVITGDDGSLTIRSTAADTEAELVFRRVSEGLTISAP